MDRPHLVELMQMRKCDFTKKTAVNQETKYHFNTFNGETSFQKLMLENTSIINLFIKFNYCHFSSLLEKPVVIRLLRAFSVVSDHCMTDLMPQSNRYWQIYTISIKQCLTSVTHGPKNDP